MNQTLKHSKCTQKTSDDEDPIGVGPEWGSPEYLYEEFTRLAETRLAQNTLKKWCKVI